MSSIKRVGIVGAGLTGLTAAWRLQRAGFEVKVFEKSQIIGGRTLTIRKDDFVFDVGAITLLPTYATMRELVDELGISQHLHEVHPVIGIPRDGVMHRLDVAHPLRSLLQLKLISTRDKLKLLKLVGPMMRTWNRSNFQSLGALADYDDETIADYVRRTMSESINEYIAGPVIRGNTLNGTEDAPAGELLWMLRQYAAPYVCGFDQGINFLAETLGSRVPVALGSEVMQVHRQDAQVVIEGERNGAAFIETFDACVIGLPPQGIRQLAPTLSARQRDFLDTLRPLVSVNLHVGLRRRPANTETFILPPKSEQPMLTTIVMDHLKAPGRAPTGKGAMSFFLRDTWGVENFATPDADVLDRVLKMAIPFVGDLRSDVESYVVQRWPYSIIKSRPGLYRQIRDYEADLDPQDRVQIGGDFLSMGMEAAISSGATMAERLKQILTTQKA